MNFIESIISVQPGPPPPPGEHAESGSGSAVPLVLIHDGGGTAVSYFYLDDLDRAVYAIPNPRFYSGEPWEGGLPEMARVYARTIRDEVRRGPVLLGGWSLGGLLSLEVASIFASDPSCPVRVLGIIMIDSIYPHAARPPAQASRPVVPAEPIFGISTKPEMRARVAHCMGLAFDMVRAWVPPVWKGCDDAAAHAARARVEHDLAQRMGPHYGGGGGPDGVRAVSGSAEKKEEDRGPGNGRAEGSSLQNLPSIPQTILLKCTEYVPVSTTTTTTTTDSPSGSAGEQQQQHDPSPDGAIARVDVTREREKLGWEDYGYDFISAVLEIPGHHFNIFTDPYIDDLSSRLKLACRMLERVNL